MQGVVGGGYMNNATRLNGRRDQKPPRNGGLPISASSGIGRAPAWNFGRSSRFTENAKDAYAVRITSVPIDTATHARFKPPRRPRARPTPGPGAYNPHLQGCIENAPSYTMRKRTGYGGYGEEVPGPGQYETYSCFSHTHPFN